MRKHNRRNWKSRHQRKLNVSSVPGEPIILTPGPDRESEEPLDEWDACLTDAERAEAKALSQPVRKHNPPTGSRAGTAVGPRGLYNPKTHRIGSAKQRSVRNMGRKRSRQVYDPASAYLELGSGPEPKDKEIDSLWACASVDDVKKLLKGWNRKFRRKCLAAIKGRKLDPEMREMIVKLLSSEATTIPIMTNPKVGRLAFKDLHRALVASVAENANIKVALVTIISGDGATSHVRPFVELHHSQQRMTSTLRAMAPNFFGVTELALFNSHSHPDGGQVIQVHGHALIWGENILGKAQKVAATHKSKFAPNMTDAPQIDVRRVRMDSVNLARVCAYLFKPPHRAMTWCPPRDGKKGHMHQSEKGDRFIRFLRMAEIRSLLTFDDICFASGDGQTIKSGLTKLLRATCEADAG